MDFYLASYTIVAIIAALLADFFVAPVLIMLAKPFGGEKTVIEATAGVKK